MTRGETVERRAAPARGRATASWRLDMGARPLPGGTQFRVWAPDARSIDCEVEGVEQPLAREADGTWSGFVPGAGPGALYRYRINGEGSFPDPYSRFQPEGPHGPSEIIDPDAFAWGDARWPGLSPRNLVIYELHVGTYTREGTFAALESDLDNLLRLGVNAIELLPVADFPGARNWGYDGVDLFAPTRNYGRPDDLRRLVDAAHARGIGVIMDVVYNHFGPDGNYLLQYAHEYLTDRHKTPWGDAINYDGQRSEWVRKFVIDNARYWIHEFHIDGLRLDATFAIIDSSKRHILAELTDRVRESVAGRRSIVLAAETYENDARYIRPTRAGGYGFDMVWSDDFHHVVHTMASREQSGYYADYAGTTEELARTINRGWLYEGQTSAHLGHARGTDADELEAWNFVYFIQNHDQVGNRAFGRRLAHLVGAAAQKPWAALHLLLPFTPMLFMGQEFVASSRFFYFTDHHDELGRAVTEGRRREFASFSAFGDGRQAAEIPDPQADETFLASKLRLEERDEGVGAERFALNAELIRLRQSDPVLRRQDRRQMRALAASDSLLIVHLWQRREQRLIVANTGVAVDAPPAAAGVPRELLGYDWTTVVSTEERRFGGTDDPVRFDASLISLPPQTVALLRASAASPVSRILSRARSAVRRLGSR